jgi:hypothetical protein
MKDESGVSRGFGFVCFQDQADATRAVSEMNGALASFLTPPSRALIPACSRRSPYRQQAPLCCSCAVEGGAPHHAGPAPPPARPCSAHRHGPIHAWSPDHVPAADVPRVSILTAMLAFLNDSLHVLTKETQLPMVLAAASLSSTTPASTSPCSAMASPSTCWVRLPMAVFQ